MAKVWVTEMSNRVADAALQLHGGYGYVSAYLVEGLYRDLQLFRITEGRSDGGMVAGWRRALKGSREWLLLWRSAPQTRPRRRETAPSLAGAIEIFEERRR